MHHIQHAIRNLTSEERSYSVCEREALPVIFALKEIWISLFSTHHFTVINEYKALQYTFKKKYIHGKLARWMCLLDKYYFKIPYRSGKKNKAAYYLSRIMIDKIKETSDDVSCILMEEMESLRMENHLEDIMRYLNGKDILEIEPER